VKTLAAHTLLIAMLAGCALAPGDAEQQNAKN
jgi:hypothetical protein